jgi:hypothetical protein
VTRRVKRVWPAVGIIIAVVAQAVIGAVAGVPGVIIQLTSQDIQRATDLARWPHTDAERAQFHKRYTIVVNGPAVEYFALETIEVTTPFRRLELIAEEHARINDLFARGGDRRDAEAALRPWRDQVSIVARLRFDLTKLIPGVPDVDVSLEGPTIVFPITTKSSRIDIAIDKGARTQIVGGLVEAVFDVRAVGQTTRPVVVRWNGKEIARVAVDFARMD